MKQYRLYCLNGANNFTTVHIIEAVDDAEALIKAREMKFAVNCELWEGRRKIAHLDAHRP